MNFFFFGGGGGEGGVRQSRWIMGDLQMAYFSFFFYPFKELEILDQLILLTVRYC